MLLVEATVSDVVALPAEDVLLVAVGAVVGDGTVLVEETLVEEPQAVAPTNPATTARQVTTVTSLRGNISHLQVTDCSTSVSLGHDDSAIQRRSRPRHGPLLSKGSRLGTNIMPRMLTKPRPKKTAPKEMAPACHLNREAEITERADVEWSSSASWPEPPMPLCPECETEMVSRHSEYGEFWGCTRFPACRGKRPLETPDRNGS